MERRWAGCLDGGSADGRETEGRVEDLAGGGGAEEK